MKVGSVTKIPELQAAVRALRGVAQATVRWPDPHGPAVLRVEFAAGADREEVTESILATVREVGEVDLESLQVDGADARAVIGPAGPAGLQTPEAIVRAGRPVFEGITVERTDLDSSVTVTLGYRGKVAKASAEGLATKRSTPRTAAAAALLALREFLPAEVRVQLEWIEVVEAAGPNRPEIVHSAVTFLTASGEETFIGTAIVRADLREAAVRATLDALNRRFERLNALVGASAS
jgi:hypothetical protein